MIGADGIKSTVREQLFSDQQPVFAGEHAYRAVVDAARRPRHWSSTTTCGCTSAAARRSTSCRCGTGARCPSTSPPLARTAAWSPEPSKDDLMAMVEGFDERIVETARDLDMDQVNVRAVYDIDPVDTWHSASRRPARGRRPLDVPPPGPGRELGDPGRRRAGRRRCAVPDSVAEALAHYQATRKPVTDELQRISRQGWSEEEVDDVFPGQKPGEAAGSAAPRRPHRPAAWRCTRDRGGRPPHPPGRRHPARPGGAARRRAGAGAAAGGARCPSTRWRTAPHSRPSARCRCGSTRRMPPRPTGSSSTSTAARSSSAASTRHDHVARSLAKETGYSVVSVGYRLAPEHAYPAGLEDCYAVVRWAAEQRRRARLERPDPWPGGRQLRRDLRRGRRGDGPRRRAGTRSPPDALHPSLDLDFDVDRYPSLRENACGYGLETAGSSRSTPSTSTAAPIRTTHGSRRSSAPT